jgi:alkylation response protein AidB-like acyl-CoA dehydrogenase
MRALHEHCIDQLGQTQRYGVALTEMQNVQAALGRQYAAIEAARTTLYRALSLLAGHEGRLDPVFDPVISAAKHEITNHGVDLAVSALRLLGGRGYLRGRAERFLRDACALLAAGGTQDVLEIELGAQAIAARGW